MSCLRTTLVNYRKFFTSCFLESTVTNFWRKKKQNNEVLWLIRSLKECFEWCIVPNETLVNRKLNSPYLDWKMWFRYKSWYEKSFSEHDFKLFSVLKSIFKGGKYPVIVGYLLILMMTKLSKTAMGVVFIWETELELSDSDVQMTLFISESEDQLGKPEANARKSLHLLRIGQLKQR